MCACVEKQRWLGTVPLDCSVGFAEKNLFINGTDILPEVSLSIFSEGLSFLGDVFTFIIFFLDFYWLFLLCFPRDISYRFVSHGP